MSHSGTVTATGLILWSGGTLTVDGTSLLEIGAGTAAAGGIAIQAGATLTANGGSITAQIADACTLSNAGSLTVTGGVTGAGTLALLSGSTTDIAGSIAGETVTFADGTPLLRLHELSGAATVTAAQVGDVVDLVGITNATVNGAEIMTGSGTLDFTNLAAGTVVELTGDGNNGTDITLAVACYACGTMILTEHGEVAVERLTAGDRIATLSGAMQAVRWIGHRTIDLTCHTDRIRAQPVRIAAHAFGQGLPHRHLWLSPEHAVFADGVLIPIRHLVNGGSIDFDASFETVRYYHVELGAHDVILAEGLPAESWLDTGNRAMFENAVAQPLHVVEGPDGSAAWTQRGYCRLVEQGPALEAVRRRVGFPAVLDVTLDHVGSHRVRIPAGVSAVRLVSGHRYANGDARRLGAAIAGVALDGALVPLTDQRLQSGFHSAEASWRWTDGAGLIALGRQRRAVALTVDVVALAPGLLDAA